MIDLLDKVGFSETTRKKERKYSPSERYYKHGKIEVHADTSINSYKFFISRKFIGEVKSLSINQLAGLFAYVELPSKLKHEIESDIFHVNDFCRMIKDDPSDYSSAAYKKIFTAYENELNKLLYKF